MPKISFTDHIYKARFHFAWNETDEELVELVNKEFETQAATLKELKESMGRAYINIDDNFIIIRQKDERFVCEEKDLISILVHECFHCASRVLRHNGLKLTDASEEAFTYYCQWIFDNCYNAMTKKKK